MCSSARLMAHQMNTMAFSLLEICYIFVMALAAVVVMVAVAMDVAVPVTVIVPAVEAAAAAFKEQCLQCVCLLLRGQRFSDRHERCVLAALSYIILAWPWHYQNKNTTSRYLPLMDTGL